MYNFSERLFFCVCLLTFFTGFGMDPRMTRPIIIDTNRLLDVSLCRPILITQDDVGVAGLTITDPGVYILSSNISFLPTGTASAVTIDGDNIQLDLQCFSVSQGNATIGVNGIEVTSGHSNILIKNGSINGFTGDGVLVNDDNSIIYCNDISISQCSRGIFLNGSLSSPIEKFFVNNCSFLLNVIGMSSNWAHYGSVIKCSSLMSEQIGFRILNSNSNKFIACNAEDTLSTTNESTYGFFVDGGTKNIFKKLCIDGTSTDATFTGDVATGFYIGADELELALKNSQISNSITTSDAQPFGIQMDYTFTELSNAGLPTFTHTNTVAAVAWSPDNRYLAMGGLANVSGVEVNVFEFDGNALTLVASLTGPSATLTVAWSVDGSYLAIARLFNILEVYEFNGASLEEVAAFTTPEGVVQAIDWSPDGRYIAVGSGSGSEGGDAVIDVVEFTGSDLLDIANITFTGALVTNLSWSPSADFIVCSIQTETPLSSDNSVEVTEFTGISLTSITSFTTGGISWASRWSPDGRYIGFGGTAGPGGFDSGVLEFTGSSLILKATYNTGDEPVVRVSWSPDGKVLSLGNGNGIEAVAFTGDSLTAISTFTTGAISAPAWSPNGTVLALNSVAGFVKVLSGFQFPSNCMITNNAIAGVQGAPVPVGMPWVSNGRGLSASSGANLIIKNTAFKNDINYIFVTDVYQQFLVNVASTVPSLIDNLSFPPL